MDFLRDPEGMEPAELRAYLDDIRCQLEIMDEDEPEDETSEEFANYLAGREDPEGELQRLVDRGYLTRAEAAAIPRAKFAAFFRSPLMDRILQADRVLREYRFFSKIPAAQAGYKGEGEILIQGIADCVLEEDGAGVLLDFKTDAASPEELRRRYGLQLELYRQALEAMFPKGIKECILYSLYSGKSVPLPKGTDRRENRRL